MLQKPKRSKHKAARRGSAYLIVLGVSLIVAALAYGGILATRTRGRIASEVSDAGEARRIARDAIQLGQLWINNDPNWRTNRTQGVWASNVAMGGGSFTLEARDPLDGNLANFPHDSVVLKATGVKGNAKHILQATIKANPTPMPCLAFAAHTAGQFNVPSGATLTATAATVSTNGTLQNSGTIKGRAECLLSTGLFGTVTDGIQIAALAKTLPDTAIVDQYAALGTLINPGSVIQLAALGWDSNPYGTPNANGIYVARPTGDLTIKDCHICGTLVVICASGKKVIVDSHVLMHPHRTDCPALIVRGDVELIFQGGANLLQEGALSVSLNPKGAPYNGVWNGNKIESFPSEIQGLVHVTGTLTMKQTATVRGAIMVNSAALFDAVKIENTPAIIYTPNLMLNPPGWYTTAVPMIQQRGSWLQLAN